jgi:hypothetical protein
MIHDRLTTTGLVTGLTFIGAIAFALVTRGPGIVGIAVLFLVFVPLEKLFALRPQTVFRRGFVTDLTHLLVNRFFVTVGAFVFAIAMALPFLWFRSFHLVDALPAPAALVLAVALIILAN